MSTYKDHDIQIGQKFLLVPRYDSQDYHPVTVEKVYKTGHVIVKEYPGKRWSVHKYSDDLGWRLSETGENWHGLDAVIDSEKMQAVISERNQRIALDRRRNSILSVFRKIHPHSLTVEDCDAIEAVFAAIKARNPTQE